MRLGHLVVALFPFAVIVAVGCSGSPSNVGDAGGDGGCIPPTEGAPCTTSEVACQPPGDICCVGYSWMCQNGVWTKAGVGCACQVDASVKYDAGPFACGGTTCNSGSQMCIDQAPGIMGPDGSTLPDSFSCANIPAACAATPTCACVTTHGACITGVSSCDETNGQITVHCMGQ